VRGIPGTGPAMSNQRKTPTRVPSGPNSVSTTLPETPRTPPKRHPRNPEAHARVPPMSNHRTTLGSAMASTPGGRPDPCRTDEPGKRSLERR